MQNHRETNTFPCQCLTRGIGLSGSICTKRRDPQSLWCAATTTGGEVLHIPRVVRAPRTLVDADIYSFLGFKRGVDLSQLIPRSPVGIWQVFLSLAICKLFSDSSSFREDSGVVRCERDTDKEPKKINTLKQ